MDIIWQQEGVKCGHMLQQEAKQKEEYKLGKSTEADHRNQRVAKGVLVSTE